MKGEYFWTQIKALAISYSLVLIVWKLIKNAIFLSKNKKTGKDLILTE